VSEAKKKEWVLFRELLLKDEKIYYINQTWYLLKEIKPL